MKKEFPFLFASLQYEGRTPHVQVLGFTTRPCSL